MQKLSCSLVKKAQGQACCRFEVFWSFTAKSKAHEVNQKGKIRANRAVPCFFNASYLLIEINEFNQLFLQYFLSANSLFDEHMLEQV